MGFKVQPEILSINEIEGLSADLQSLTTNAAALSSQTDTLGGSIPESSKGLTVTLKIPRFVALGSSDTFAYSSDCINWIQGNLPQYRQWSDIVYGNGKFVIVDMGNPYSSEYSFYSNDGITWTQNSMPYKRWQSITYADNKFVAVTYFNESAYSSDGINWNVVPLNLSYAMSITYGNGKFVVVANQANQSSYSSDGITWTQTTMPSSQAWRSVTYGNNKFVAIAIGGITAYSSDGITWISSTMPSAEWLSIVYGNNKFVAVSQYGPHAYSTDGINWNTFYLGGNNNSVIYAGGKFVSVGFYSFHYSNDGITWTTINAPGQPFYESVTYGEIPTSKTIAEILGVE